MPSQAAPILIAVDIGNSRIKLGRFESGTTDDSASAVPAPSDTCELPITFPEGRFDAGRLADWCSRQAGENARWMMASVHRGAAQELTAFVASLPTSKRSDGIIQNISFRDVPLDIRVDEPGRVGIDRLLAALAADRLRRRDRGAIIVDIGSAMTVDIVNHHGAFLGGAILPGLAMSAHALAEQTDALPHIRSEQLRTPPPPLGNSTVAAIESGLYWGAVGAIRELVRRLSAEQSLPPDVFLTGGASQLIGGLLTEPVERGATSGAITAQHVPHLVLAGIAIVDRAAVAKP
jgi:type III pantothenate kinase